MTRCNATAELVDANMQVIPGITLVCELEAGHHLDRREHPLGGLIDEVDYGEAVLEYERRTGRNRWWGDAWRVVPATDHAFTFRWADPTADELAEVLNPDEAFDLEVDIADEGTLIEQTAAAEDNGMFGPSEVDIVCPVCGAYGAMQCSTMTGRDHRKRMLAELAGLDNVDEL